MLNPSANFATRGFLQLLIKPKRLSSRKTVKKAPLGLMNRLSLPAQDGVRMGMGRKRRAKPAGQSRMAVAEVRRLANLVAA